LLLTFLDLLTMPFDSETRDVRASRPVDNVFECWKEAPGAFAARLA